MVRPGGGTLQIHDTVHARSLLSRAADVQGLNDYLVLLARAAERPDPPALAAAVDFVLEGLYAQKKSITRSDEFQAPVRR